jgi:hypothetical protein
MPKGPQGQKRPAEVIGNAVRVMRIATGDIAEDEPETAKEYARNGGLKGGRARAAKLTKAQKTDIARKAAEARWGANKSKAETASASISMVLKSRKARAHFPKNQNRNT